MTIRTAVSSSPAQTCVIARILETGYPTSTVSDVVTVGSNIKAWREHAGFKTQVALAKALGVPASRVNEWERGRYKRPDTKTLEAIAAACNCRVDDLLANVGEPVDGEHKKSEAAARESRYSLGSDSTIHRDPSHAGSDPVVAFSVALSRAKLPSDVDALVQTIHEYMQRLTDTRLFLERLGAAVHSLGHSSTHGVRPGRDAVDPSPHQARHRKSPRAASRRRAG